MLRNFDPTWVTEEQTPDTISLPTAVVDENLTRDSAVCSRLDLGLYVARSPVIKGCSVLVYAEVV